MVLGGTVYGPQHTNGHNRKSQILSVLHFANRKLLAIFKNLLMGLFLMGCFLGDFQEGKGPDKALKATVEGGKRLINEENGP